MNEDSEVTERDSDDAVERQDAVLEEEVVQSKREERSFKANAIHQGSSRRLSVSLSRTVASSRDCPASAIQDATSAAET